MNPSQRGPAALVSLVMTVVVSFTSYIIRAVVSATRRTSRKVSVRVLGSCILPSFILGNLAQPKQCIDKAVIGNISSYINGKPRTAVIFDTNSLLYEGSCCIVSKSVRKAIS